MQIHWYKQFEDDEENENLLFATGGTPPEVGTFVYIGADLERFRVVRSCRYISTSNGKPRHIADVAIKATPFDFESQDNEDL